MKKTRFVPIRLFIANMLICSFISCFAENVVVNLTDSIHEVNISGSVYYFKDQNDRLTIKDILTGKYENDFIRNTGSSISFGNIKTSIWHKFTLNKTNSSKTKWLLIVDNHHLDSITLYTPNDKGEISIERSGRLIPFNDRHFKYNTFAFELPFSTSDTQVYYLKVSSYLFKYPLQVIQYERLNELQMSRSIIMGSLIGFLLMIVLYNLFIYFIERDKNYLFYITYVFISIIKITDMKGFMDIFWQGPLGFMRSQTPGITAFLGVSMILFTVNILDFRKNLPKAIKWILILFGPMLIGTLYFNLVDLKLYSSYINQVASLVLTVFLYVCAFIIYKNGYRPARFYIIAVSMYFLSICVYALSLFGWFPLNDVTDNLIEFGSATEMLLFSLALADKIREYKRAKNRAEKDLLKTLQENEELILNQNKVLEIKVEERTRALNEEKEKSDTLLLNILPAEIADELKINGQSQARLYDNTSVLFTDFVNFTGISEKFSPTELVQEINHCFTAFDNIVGRIGLEKIKTIGDAYLAVCGLPQVDEHHAVKTIQVALEIKSFMADYFTNGGTFEIRIGIHSGPLVAGIVGVKKFAYDIWGDTVNTAARMEQNSESGKINISGTTYELVKDQIICEHRGKISAKNKGEIDMYFVERLK